jgi:hypothetical protein
MTEPPGTDRPRNYSASSMQARTFQDFALRLAPHAAAVANFSDHVEHNEFADRAWVLDAAAALRTEAVELATAARLCPVELYAERIGEIEARNVLAHPGAYDGHQAVLVAATWRDVQIAQVEHDRYYHPDVIGLAKDQQLRHYALHVAKIVGAFAEPRDEQELLRRRLPDALLFGVKLETVMNVRLADEPLPRIRPSQPTSRPAAAAGR